MNSISFFLFKKIGQLERERNRSLFRCYNAEILNQREYKKKHELEHLPGFGYIFYTSPEGGGRWASIRKYNRLK